MAGPVEGEHGIVILSRHASARQDLNADRVAPGWLGAANPNRRDPIQPRLQAPVTELARKADLVPPRAALDREAARGTAVGPAALDEEDDSRRPRKPEGDRRRRLALSAARRARPRGPQAPQPDARTICPVTGSCLCTCLAGRCGRRGLCAGLGSGGWVGARIGSGGPGGGPDATGGGGTMTGGGGTWIGGGGGNGAAGAGGGEMMEGLREASPSAGSGSANAGRSARRRPRSRSRVPR